MAGRPMPADHFAMKTIDCSTLETLIENQEPIDLIDIRPQREFAVMHVPGARSLPLEELTRPRIYRPTPPRGERVYVISNNCASASLASGILHASTGAEAVVVDGGIGAWIEQGLPVRSQSSLKLPRLLRRTALALAVAGCSAFALKEAVVAGLLLAIAAILALKAARLPRPGPSEVEVAEMQTADKRLPIKVGA
jgi:rhodanese-related sulfurtransferase